MRGCRQGHRQRTPVSGMKFNGSRVLQCFKYSFSKGLLFGCLTGHNVCPEYGNRQEDHDACVVQSLASPEQISVLPCVCALALIYMLPFCPTLAVIKLKTAGVIFTCSPEYAG